MHTVMIRPERRLWTAQRADRFGGLAFSRPVAGGSSILDVAARARKLAIEVDGGTHGGNETRDERRRAWLAERGYRVIRFSNADVMRNLEGVLAVEDTLRASPFPKASFHRGGGLI